MLALPQPSNFLHVDLPGAATSSFSAAGSASRKAPRVRNIQGRKRNDLASRLSPQPPEERWLGETRNHPRAWPCSPGAGRGHSRGALWLAKPVRSLPIVAASTRRAQHPDPQFNDNGLLPVVPHKAVAEVSKNWKPIGEIGCCESGMAERIHWWTERCLRSPLFLSLSLSFSDYLPTYLPIYLSIDLSISLTLSFI